MNLYDLLDWFAHAELLGNRYNILAVAWALILTFTIYKRIKGMNPLFKKELTGFKRSAIAFGVAGMTVYFLQLLIDDFITTPIDTAFGSWSLMVGYGNFTLMKILLFKADIYLMIVLLFLGFTMLDLWQMFHWTRWSTIALVSLIGFQIVLAYAHYWNQWQYSGVEMVKEYWLSYPEFRVLSGLFVASIIRKSKHG